MAMMIATASRVLRGSTVSSRSCLDCRTPRNFFPETHRTGGWTTESLKSRLSCFGAARADIGKVFLGCFFVLLADRRLSVVSSRRPNLPLIREFVARHPRRRPNRCIGMCLATSHHYSIGCAMRRNAPRKSPVSWNVAWDLKVDPKHTTLIG